MNIAKLYRSIAIASVGLAVLGTSWAVDDKKGVGLAESKGLGDTQLKSLQVAWYYNWGPSSQIKTHIPFVPMAFRVKTIEKLPARSAYVLGFNEPDNEKQSDLSVAEALFAWPGLQSRAQAIGAPAMAGNPAKSSSWLYAFMRGQPKVDFVTLHWYKGANAKKFIDDVQALCETYKKPVWVTEFAPQTAGDARENPNRFSQAEVEAFIEESTQWMRKSDCVQRYAWHDAKVGTSSLFEGKELSATGKAYGRVGH